MVIGYGPICRQQRWYLRRTDSALGHVILHDHRAAVLHVIEQPLIVGAQIGADVAGAHAGHDRVETGQIAAWPDRRRRAASRRTRSAAARPASSSPAPITYPMFFASSFDVGAHQLRLRRRKQQSAAGMCGYAIISVAVAILLIAHRAPSRAAALARRPMAESARTPPSLCSPAEQARNAATPARCAIPRDFQICTSPAAFAMFACTCSTIDLRALLFGNTSAGSRRLQSHRRHHRQRPRQLAVHMIDVAIVHRPRQFDLRAARSSHENAPRAPADFPAVRCPADRAPCICRPPSVPPASTVAKTRCVIRNASR